MYKKFFKRVFDIILSFMALSVLLPILAIFTIIVAVKMKGSPFFIQERPGRYGKTFKLIKYRTMTNTKDENGELLSDAKRLTEFGKFMRKFSLDELPELLNILIGDMSIVGPRPLLVSYLPLYDEYQFRRHEVRPGLTGLAQISGRNAISWEDKFDKDIEYVEKCSLKLDIKIIFKTIKKVLLSEGISQEGEATMEFFKGSSKSDNIINVKSEDIETVEETDTELSEIKDEEC